MSCHHNQRFCVGTRHTLVFRCSLDKNSYHRSNARDQSAAARPGDEFKEARRFGASSHICCQVTHQEPIRVVVAALDPSACQNHSRTHPCSRCATLSRGRTCCICCLHSLGRIRIRTQIGAAQLSSALSATCTCHSNRTEAGCVRSRQPCSRTGFAFRHLCGQHGPINARPQQAARARPRVECEPGQAKNSADLRPNNTVTTTSPSARYSAGYASAPAYFSRLTPSRRCVRDPARSENQPPCSRTTPPCRRSPCGKRPATALRRSPPSNRGGSTPSCCPCMHRNLPERPLDLTRLPVTAQFADT